MYDRLGGTDNKTNDELTHFWNMLTQKPILDCFNVHGTAIDNVAATNNRIAIHFTLQKIVQCYYSNSMGEN